MNQQLHSEKQTEMLSNIETITTDTDMLVQSGFTSEEIMALLWLRQWYQSGGSDRVEVVRHLEFLKLLDLNGKIEF